MPHVFSLPKDETQRCDVISNILLQGRGIRNPVSIRWWLASAYMMGIREFSAINYSSGTVSIAYLNEAGLLKFRYEEIVAKYQSQLGRLYSLDLSPAVRMKGISLDGMRKASVAQVVLDAAMTEDKIDRLKSDLCPPLLMFGTVGVGLWVDSADSQGIEVIPPWQLFPIPVNIAGPNEVRGLIRYRPVPVDWLKELKITPGARSKDWKEVDSASVPRGHLPLDMDTLGEGLVSMTAGGGGFSVHTQSLKDNGMAQGKTKKDDQTNVPITGLTEVWTETSDGYLATYSIYAGITKLKELYFQDHTAERYPMPVRVIRDVTIGSFWGRSYVDMMIPLNHEIEVAMSSLFEAVSDFDLYGLQLWPTTLGNPTLAERGQDGIKRIRYEPDYTCPEIKIENVMPAKMTNPQLMAVNLASSMLDKIANQPSQMMSGQAPGRMDSAAGINLLYETSGIPLSPTAKNIAEGVEGCYRSLLRILKDMWDDQKVVNVSSLDDSLAGIVLDADAGTLSLSKNAIPMPEEVTIKIASEIPVSRTKDEAELKEALKAGRITIDEFNWTVRKKGLNIPVGDEIGWQNYRRAMLNNILLFGDGETPGKIVISPHDLHRIHIQVMQSFMARPEFFSADGRVRQAFDDAMMERKGQMGMFPDALPYPEDTAAAMMGQPPQGDISMMQGGSPQMGAVPLQ